MPGVDRELALRAPSVYNAIKELNVNIDPLMATWAKTALHPSLRESCLLPPFIRRNAPFELDSRIAGWPGPGITLSIPLP